MRQETIVGRKAFARALKEANYKPGFNLGGPSTLKRSSKRMRPLSKKKAKTRKAFSKTVLERDPVCMLCNENKSVHAHHVLSKGRGGSDDPINGVGLCFSCHRFLHDNPLTAEALGLLERFQK